MLIPALSNGLISPASPKRLINSPGEGAGVSGGLTSWFSLSDVGADVCSPCAFVSTVGAVVIGLVAGVLCCASVFLIERKLKVDDPVGAIAVHGFNGAWGLIALGLFADGTYGDGLNNVAGTVRGLFYGGASQFIAQIVGVVVNFVFVFVLMYVFFKSLNKVIPLRVSEEIEFEGLDASQVSVTAYPDFSITKTHG